MRANRRNQLGVTATISLILAACGGNTPDEPVDNIESRSEPTVQAPAPADPDPDPGPDPVVSGPETGNAYGQLSRAPCNGSSTCENVATLSVGHGPAGVELFYDPQRDDAIVRWGAMLSGVISCVDQGGELDSCVDATDAPDFCKSEFRRLTDAADARAAFDAVFLTRGSPCRPEEDQQ